MESDGSTSTPWQLQPAGELGAAGQAGCVGAGRKPGSLPSTVLTELGLYPSSRALGNCSRMYVYIDILHKYV